MIRGELMKKKVLICVLCLVLLGSGVFGISKLFKKEPAPIVTEQTQVESYINLLNSRLLKDSNYLDYGCIAFDTRDNELAENELDVSDITYKKPVLGYVFVEDVFVDNPRLTSFTESLSYISGLETKKQITNYVFYFEDSEVSGARYVTNYAYHESGSTASGYYVDYEVKFDKKFITNASYLNKFVNVKDYYDETIEEDGKEYNWTTAIQKACAEINKTGGVLYFPYDTYLVSVSKDLPDVLFLQSKNEIVVDFFGSKLKLASNNLSKHRMVMVTQCDKVTIKNGVLQGDRMIHDYGEPGDNYGPTHEWGYGVNVRATRVADINNMEIYDFTGDGVCFSNTYGMEKNEENKYVYVGNPTTVNIDKSLIHHCRRQGVSVIDCKGFNITDTEIHSIGQFSWAYENDCVSDDLKNVVVKGTAPSAGIDFEPDRYTFLVEKAVVDNCYIHNTDNFAMVNTTVPTEIKEQGYLTTTPNLVIRNTLASSNPNLSGENINEGGVFRQAVVENCTFVYDKLLSWSGYDENGDLKQNGAFGITRLKFVNSKIVKTYKGHISIWVEDSEFYNCLFEHNKNTLDETIGVQNGLISFSKSKLVGNTFNNFIGTGKNTTYYSDHGILFFTNEEHGITLAEGSTGNVFNNSSVFLRRGLTISNNSLDEDFITFNDCQVYAYPSSTEAAHFKNIVFKNCETGANTGAELVFENCRLINSGAFHHYKRKFINCYIEFEEMNELINYNDDNGNSYGSTPFGGHTLGDSKSPSLYGTVIVVKGDISHSNYDIRAFRNSYFYDGCVIILNVKYESKKVVLKEHEDRSVEIKYS